MSGGEFAVLAVALTLGGCLQGSLGFGLGMLAGPVVALVDPTLIPGTLLVLATVLTLAGAVTDRAHLDLGGARWALLGRVPGTAGGLLLVAYLSPEALGLALAAVVLLGAALTAAGWSPLPTSSGLVAAGAASGLMGTATSIGGPPMALIWQRSAGPALRGTMSAFFLVGCLMSLAGLIAIGEVDRTTLARAAALTPFVLAGYAASRLLNRWLDTGLLRPMALCACVVGALTVVVRSL